MTRYHRMTSTNSDGVLCFTGGERRLKNVEVMIDALAQARLSSINIRFE